MAAKTMPATAIQEETNNREAEHKKADRLIHFMPGGGATWSMLPAMPPRLGQWRPPGPGDLVNVARDPARLGQCCPPWQAEFASVGGAEGRLCQCCPRGRSDLVIVGRPGERRGGIDR